ncbi:MAG: HDOD domain-containing protein [Planctomycetota bacterium]|jgi:putative nucleotidyltransferase with HDIG domain
MSSPSAQSFLSQERTRRKILSEADRIPMLPELVSKVLNLLSEADTEPERLASELEQDPALVAKMLGLANSPYYGVSHPVSTVKQAIMVVGFQGIRTLLLTTGSASLLEGDYSYYGHDEKGLLRHSLTVAFACRELAKLCKLPASQREDLFVAGLLHDIGKMLLAPRLSECRVTPQSFPGAIHEMEQKLIGLDHTEAGALVTAKWSLSEFIGDCLRHHHDATLLEDNEPALAVLRLADALAHELGYGYRKGAAPEAIYLASDLKALGLDEGHWQATRSDLAESVRAAMSTSIFND